MLRGRTPMFFSAASRHPSASLFYRALLRYATPCHDMPRYATICHAACSVSLHTTQSTTPTSKAIYLLQKNTWLSSPCSLATFAALPASAAACSHRPKAKWHRARRIRSAAPTRSSCSSRIASYASAAAYE